VPIAAPFDRVAIQDALRDAVVFAVGGAVIWANQDGAAPALPYVTLNLHGDESPAMDESVIDGEPLLPVVGGEVELLERGLRRATLSINTYARSNEIAADDAHMMMDKIRAAFGLESVRVALIAAGVGVNSFSPIRELDFIAADRFKTRAQLDVRVNFASNAAQQVGYIATVRVNSAALNWTNKEFEVAS
jgi:hypothetical protein